MREFYPLLIVGAVIGVISLVFIIAYLSIKDKKEAIGFERNMKDSDILKNLLKYAKPYVGSFVIVLLVMLFSIAYNTISPLLIGQIEEIIKNTVKIKKRFVPVGENVLLYEKKYQKYLKIYDALKMVVG